MIDLEELQAAPNNLPVLYEPPAPIPRKVRLVARAREAGDLAFVLLAAWIVAAPLMIQPGASRLEIWAGGIACIVTLLIATVIAKRTLWRRFRPAPEPLPEVRVRFTLGQRLLLAWLALR